MYLPEDYIIQYPLVLDVVMLSSSVKKNENRSGEGTFQHLPLKEDGSLFSLCISPSG